MQFKTAAQNKGFNFIAVLLKDLRETWLVHLVFHLN